MSSHPVTCYLGEVADYHLAITSFQVVVESDTFTNMIMLITLFLIQIRMPLAFFGQLGTLLAQVQLLSTSTSRSFSSRQLSSLSSLKPVMLHGIVVIQGQDPVHPLIEPHNVGHSPSFQSVKIPLQSLLTIQQINTPIEIGSSSSCSSKILYMAVLCFLDTFN
ncbi:hypothetical protein WISP_94770 [Willisornis vidua]|uniref:Uncharacterized protein n=1 Tax=Willisornis vidua TaxID=1566151 RepID=A0ABQ9D576_9PASS|nr:hypothetical protein WISP_94770 [Willisornis vidua]